MDDLAVAQFVDLDFQQTIDGVQYMATTGIFSEGRAAEVLADGTTDEIA
jgi:hypothetical protein